MKFHRTYSTPDDPYAGIDVRAAHLADRQPRRVGDLRSQGRHGADRLEPGRGRRARPEVLPQGRRAQGAPPRARGRRARVAVALGRRPGRARRDIARRSVRTRARRPSGLRPAGGLLDVLGLEARLLRLRRRRPRLPRRDVRDARAPNRRAELAAMVQHRAALGVRHFRPGARALVRRSHPTARRKASPNTYEHPQVSACYILSIEDDLVNEGGIFDGVASRGAHLQRRLGIGRQLLAPARAPARNSPAAARARA